MKEKKFYKRIFILTLPIIIQNLIVQMLNMADTLMIGRLGELELAAVGIANQYFFMFSLVLFGINAGTSMYIAQYWGKKDKENIRRMTRIGLQFSLIATSIFTIIAMRYSKEIISIFNPNEEVVALGSRYLITVALSYLATSISISFAFASRSIENTFLPMLASIIALGVNIVLNYILIFGKFGFNPMGVEGAAWATVIARFIEAITIIIYIYYNKLVIAINLKKIHIFQIKYISLAIGGILPILINEIVWGLGTTTYNIIYARLGVSATATIQITTTVINLFMIVIFALGNSAMIVVGKEIGKGDIEAGNLYAKKLCKLSLLIGLFIGIFIFILAPYIVRLFNVNEEILIAGEKILKINALILLLRTYVFIMIVGILRGGGDARFGAILQGLSMWFVGIPLVYYAAFILKLPLYYVIIFTIAEELIKVIFIVRRFSSGKWINNLVEESKSFCVN